MNSSGGRGRDDDEEGRAAAKAQLGSADGDGSRKGVRCGSTLAAAATRRSREGVPDLAGGQSKWAFIDRFAESGT